MENEDLYAAYRTANEDGYGIKAKQDKARVITHRRNGNRK